MMEGQRRGGYLLLVDRTSGGSLGILRTGLYADYLCRFHVLAEDPHETLDEVP